MAALKLWNSCRRWRFVQLATVFVVMQMMLVVTGPRQPSRESAFATGKGRPRARVRRCSGAAAEQDCCAVDVVEQFKQIQKANHTLVDWPWVRFCVREAGGVTAPSRLPTELVETFLGRWRRGELNFRHASQDTLDKLNMHKHCAKVQKRWNWYCAHKKRCYGVQDPAALPADVVEHFLEYHCPGSLPEWIEKPAELASMDLVQRVNSLQRRDPAARWPWARYCEKEAQGVRAPSQLPNRIVRRFLEEWKQGRFRVQRPSEETLRTLEEKMKSKKVKKAWDWYVGHTKKCYGQRTPQALPAALVEDFLTRHCAVSSR